MPRKWTFGQKLGAGFAVTVLLTFALGAVALRALKSVVEGKDRVITVDGQVLLDAERLHTATERKGGALRGFLLTREERFIDQMREAQGEFIAALARVRANTADAEARRLIEAVERAGAEHQQGADRLIAMRRGEASLDAVARAFDEQVAPKRDLLDAAVESFVTRQERATEAARQASGQAASSHWHLTSCPDRLPCRQWHSA